MKEKLDKSRNIFINWFLNNRFSVVLLNLALFLLNAFLALLIIQVFNKIFFIANPVWVFISAILPPVVLALVQFYLMNPVVDYCEAKFKIPRVATIAVLFIFVLFVLIFVINWLAPIVQNQTVSLLNNWPSIWQDAQQAFHKMIHDPHLSSFRGQINDAISNAQDKLLNSGRDYFNLVLSNISSAVDIISMIAMTLLTAPFVLFFMLKDGHKVVPSLVKLAPRRLRPSFASLLRDMNKAIASYVRGQLTVAFWVGVMFSVGYSIIGLNYGITLAILAALMNLIPYLGTLISFIPTIVVAIMASPMMIVKVLIVLAIEQVIEGRVISPMVMGNKLDMSPVTTILLLIGAGAVAGLGGVVFGIPVYAVLKIIVTRIFNYYRRVSTFYRDDDYVEKPEPAKKIQPPKPAVPAKEK